MPTGMGPVMLDFGAPFAPGVSVVDDGSEKRIAKLSGYSIVEARPLAGAKRLTKGHPFLSDKKGKYSIDIFELVQM